MATSREAAIAHSLNHGNLSGDDQGVLSLVEDYLFDNKETEERRERFIVVMNTIIKIMIMVMMMTNLRNTF